MHSSYFVLALAALSAALPLDGQETAPSPHLEARWTKNGVPGALYAFPFCPQPGTSLDQAVIDQPLNTTDLGIALAGVIDFCNQGNQLNPSGGAMGMTSNSGAVTAQLCNFASSPSGCDATAIQNAFTQINCGTQQDPIMGLSA